MGTYVYVEWRLGTHAGTRYPVPRSTCFLNVFSWGICWRHVGAGLGLWPMLDLCHMGACLALVGPKTGGLLCWSTFEVLEKNDSFRDMLGQCCADVRPVLDQGLHNLGSGSSHAENCSRHTGHKASAEIRQICVRS